MKSSFLESKDYQHSCKREKLSLYKLSPASLKAFSAPMKDTEVVEQQVHLLF